MKVVRPLVLFVETRPNIPPPFDFREKYKKTYFGDTDHLLAGCSVQAFHNIGKKYGYSTSEVLLEDMTMMRDEYLKEKLRPEQHYILTDPRTIHYFYADGYYCHPLARFIPEEEDRFDWFNLYDQNLPVDFRGQLIHDLFRARRWKRDI